MKLISRIFDKLISKSSIVMETAVSTIELGRQIVRLAQAVAKLAWLINTHASAIQELQKFNKQLIEAMGDAGRRNNESVIIIEDNPLDDDDKRKLN